MPDFHAGKFDREPTERETMNQKDNFTESKTMDDPFADRAPAILEEGAATFRERNKAYGESYKNAGQVYKALFPDDIILDTEDDHTRFQLLSMTINKLVRYSNNFRTGGHDDSALDASVYWAMLLEIDRDIAKRADNGPAA